MTQQCYVNHGHPDGDLITGRLEPHWKQVKTAVQAQEKAKEMRRSTPEWKLNKCMQLLSDKPPNLSGAARITHVYFTSAELADAAVQCLANLEGGVMEVSKSCGRGASSTTPAPESPLVLVTQTHRVRNQMQLEPPRLQRAAPTPRNLPPPRQRTRRRLRKQD